MSALSFVRIVPLVLLAAGGSVACTRARTEGLDTSKLPVEVRDDYAIFARRCSKCHSLARPLTSGITDYEQWVLYANRMRRQPGSGISLDDQEHILRFLRYYSAELRRERDERNGIPPAVSPPPPSSPAPAPPLPPPTPPPDGPSGDASPTTNVAAPPAGGVGG